MIPNPWDAEYRERGIPSSLRSEASGVLVWALANWPYLTDSDSLYPSVAIDVGCGTGRNAMHMAALNISVLGFDASAEAVDRARERANAVGDSTTRLLLHDLQAGLPAPDHSADFISDVFVYKHQLSAAARAAYRAEMLRVLKPRGAVLVSLALADDGYYSTCPDLADPEGGNPRTIVDPVVGIGSVLYTLPQLEAEFSRDFRLEMAWIKAKMGRMHGQDYLRRTLATVWRPR